MWWHFEDKCINIETAAVQTISKLRQLSRQLRSQQWLRLARKDEMALRARPFPNHSGWSESLRGHFWMIKLIFNISKLFHYFQSFLLFSYPTTHVTPSMTPGAEGNCLFQSPQWTENKLLSGRKTHPGWGSVQTLRQINSGGRDTQIF